MDRTDEPPERYWVIRPFLHFAALGNDLPVIRCGICDEVMLRADNPVHDKTAMLMWQGEPICARDAADKISGHPITPTYLEWMEEGDPRWWSPWFCDCEGCEIASVISSSGQPPG